MRKNKIFGLLVAVGGIATTVVTSFALYLKIADPAIIQIGVNTYSGNDITYRVDRISSLPTEGLRIGDIDHEASASRVTHDYSFLISSDSNTDSFYGTQLSTYGKLKVVIRCDTVELANNLLITNPYLGGYTTDYTDNNGLVNSYAEKYAQACLKNAWIKSEKTITMEQLVAVYPDKKVVNNTAEAGSNTLNFGLALGTSSNSEDNNETFTDISEENFLAVAEDKYSIEVTWTKPDNYNGVPYIAGSMNGWQCEDGYQMVPNLGGANKYEWSYTGLELAVGEEYKPRTNGDIWATNTENLSVNSDTTVDIYVPFDGTTMGIATQVTPTSN